MEKPEIVRAIVDRLFDPKYERTNKYVPLSVKYKYLQLLMEKNWTKICGPDLARNCCIHKFEFENKTLVIRTKSSTWANNLFMMQKLFLQKINAFLLGKVIIKDLKFYSGGVIERYEARAESKAVAEIKQYEKIVRCPKCGARMLFDSVMCSVCEREEKEALKTKIAELLRVQPWLDYENFQNYVKCDKILFTAIKDGIQNIYFERVRLNYAGKHDCMMAVMFLTGQKPDEIDDKTYANTLEYLRRDQIVPACRLGLYGKKQ